MRVIFALIGIMMISLFSCHKSESEDVTFKNMINDSTTMEEDVAFLNKLYLEIQTIANSVPCSNPEEWKFIPLGNKACGGPNEYIAYNIKIDEAAFLAKTDYYTRQQTIFNEKWGIISDCSLPPSPKGVICENNKPQFFY
jgi:hypothetical protein